MNNWRSSDRQKKYLSTEFDCAGIRHSMRLYYRYSVTWCIHYIVFWLIAQRVQNVFKCEVCNVGFFFVTARCFVSKTKLHIRTNKGRGKMGRYTVNALWIHIRVQLCTSMILKSGLTPGFTDIGSSDFLP